VKIRWDNNGPEATSAFGKGRADALAGLTMMGRGPSKNHQLMCELSLKHSDMG